MLIQLNVSGKQGGNFKSTQQMQIKKSKTKNTKNKQEQHQREATTLKNKRFALKIDKITSSGCKL